jgi:hypothetical protein
MYIYLLKNAHAQNGENAVKAGRQAEPPLYDGALKDEFEDLI